MEVCSDSRGRGDTCPWRTFQKGADHPHPSQDWSWRLEANRLEERQRLTGADSRCPPRHRRAGRGVRSPPLGGRQKQWWGPAAAAELSCPREHWPLSKEGFVQLRPHGAWPLWTCLSAFRLRASPSAESDSRVTEASRAEAAARCNLAH